VLPDATVVDLLQSTSQLVFPTWANPRIVGLNRVSGGWECDVFSFTLESGVGESPSREPLILRVYQGAAPERKARIEFDVMRRLRVAGYPVPEVLSLVVDDSPLRRPFVIMRKIEGPVLGNLIEKATGDRQIALLRQFCGLVVQLHALDWSAVVPDEIRVRTTEPISRWISEAEATLSRFPTRAFDPAIDWIKAHQSAIRGTRLSLVHQDFHPWNVLLDAPSAAYVIDWTQVDLSDYRLDLAWTLLLVRAVLGDAARQVLLNEYERLQDGRVEDLPLFEAIAATKRLASIYLSLTAGAESLGMRPGAEATMLENPHHLLAARAALDETAGLRIPEIESLLEGSHP
jgi:aminoglycoside phosphotransferase (APT) family kinase protein